MKEEFRIPSRDGIHQLHCLQWVPQGNVKAVLQIVHGMCEHIGRYDEFGRFLAEKGVLVVGHSHLGHGLTAGNKEELGWFGEPDGNALLIGDIHAVRERTAGRYPGVPYFILGHSMGSFLTRQYLGLHGDGLAGAIIMGSADIPRPVLVLGQTVCRCLAAVKGWRHRSAFVSSMVTDGYRKKYGLGWLSKNEESNAAYEADPRCGFRFTLNGFYSLFRGLERAVKQEAVGQFPKRRPILFTAGAEDPVGNNGKGVEALYRRYCSHGARACIKLYSGMRHEILNEPERQTVYRDLGDWIHDHL